VNLKPSGHWCVGASGVTVFDDGLTKIATAGEDLPGEMRNEIAELLVEAGNVMHKTGMTPRELLRQTAKRIAKLESALRFIKGHECEILPCDKCCEEARLALEAK